MARRLNWEKANFQKKAEKRVDSEHVSIAGAPDMQTFFANKVPLKKSGVTPQRRKKQNSVAKLSKTKRRNTTVVCPECRVELKTLGSTTNHARASLRAHTKKVHKDIFKSLLAWEKEQRTSQKNKAKKGTPRKRLKKAAKKRKKIKQNA